MANYVSKIFATPEEFEQWISKGKQLTDDDDKFGALQEITPEKEYEWDKKGCNFGVTADGKLQLLCKDGDCLAEVSICHADGDTIERDGTGVLTVKGFKQKNSDDTFSMWMGTQAEYDNILVKDPNTFYWITDDSTLDEILLAISTLKSDVDKILDGTTSVPDADFAANASYADEATYAASAGEAGHATSADEATYAASAGEAGHATSADEASNADNASLVNNVNIHKDENGILYADGMVVPYLKTIFNTTTTLSTSPTTDTEITLLNGATLKIGTIYEVEFQVEFAPDIYRYVCRCVCYNKYPSSQVGTYPKLRVYAVFGTEFYFEIELKANLGVETDLSKCLVRSFVGENDEVTLFRIKEVVQ